MKVGQKEVEIMELILTKKPEALEFTEKYVYRLVGEIEVDGNEYLVFYSKIITTQEDKMKYLPEIVKVIEIEL
jgi:protein associated with RNAse G/E